MHGHSRASFGIGQGMVMLRLFIVIAKILGQSQHLMVLGIRQQHLRAEVCAIELEVGIPHVIVLVQSLQDALVERNAMRHHGKTFHLSFHLAPHFWKQWRILGVFFPDAMHFGGPKIVIVRHWLNLAVELVCNLVILDDDDAHAASTCQLSIGRFEINGNEVMQMVSRDV